MCCYLDAKLIHSINYNTAIEEFDKYCESTRTDDVDDKIDITFPQKYTVLHRAMDCKNLNLAEHIIKKYPETMKISKCGIMGGTPIECVIRQNYCPALNLLLKYNSPIYLNKFSCAPNSLFRIQENSFKLLFLYGINVEKEFGIEKFIDLDVNTNLSDMPEIRLKKVKIIKKSLIQELWFLNRALEHLPKDIQAKIRNNIYYLT